MKERKIKERKKERKNYLNKKNENLKYACILIYTCFYLIYIYKHMYTCVHVCVCMCVHTIVYI